VADGQRTWAAVQVFMRQRCGVVLADDQAYLLEARLGPVASELRFPSINELVLAACAPGASASLTDRMIHAMTTHETSFFRDRPFWKTLEEWALPAVLARVATGRPLRIWSAASSSGQEIYSVAMLLDELRPDLAASAELYATDISPPSLEQGRAGRYSLLEVNRGLGAARLTRHFEQDGASYRVKGRLRERVRWSICNLLGGDPPPPPCDLVLCRNVLIYFDEGDRARALRRLTSGTAPDGLVAVGAAELLPAAPLHPGWYSARQLFH
jgi:chemotaxis protein methyltransferase CheR